MLGEKVRHFAEHPAISLEVLVPSGHFYRHLKRALDLTFVRDLVRDCYAAGGRPGIDPVVFFKLQLALCWPFAPSAAKFWHSCVRTARRSPWME